MYSIFQLRRERSMQIDIQHSRSRGSLSCGARFCLYMPIQMAHALKSSKKLRRRAAPFVLLHSPGNGESEARLRFASRPSDIATSWQSFPQGTVLRPMRIVSRRLYVMRVCSNTSLNILSRHPVLLHILFNLRESLCEKRSHRLVPYFTGAAKTLMMVRVVH
jgi:hypothetical protein